MGISFSQPETDCLPGLATAARSLEGDAQRHAASLILWLRSSQNFAQQRDRLAVRGTSSEAESAIRDLEEMVRAKPGDPGPANDLAAIYYTAAGQLERPTYLLRAIEVLTPHLSGPHPPDEVLWNAALLFDELALQEESRESWQRYLRQDGNSLWAAEAGRRLRRLRRLELRSGGLSPLKSVHHLPFVRPSKVEGSARKRLESFRDHFERMGKDDVLMAEAGLQAQEALGRGDEGEIARLADLHESLESGYSAYQDEKSLDDAKRLFAAAKLGFEAEKSPLALWAEYCLALVNQRNDRLAASLGLIEKLSSKLAGTHYDDLLAHVDWLHGLVLFRLGHPLEALAPYQRSVALYSQRDDSENAATVEVLIGETLFSLGRDEEAWKYLLAESRRALPVRDPRRALILAATRTETAAEAGYQEAALLFQKEALESAAALRNVPLKLLVSTELIRLQIHGGRRQEALRSLESALSLLDSLQNEETSTRALADLAPLKARLYGKIRRAESLQDLAAALAFYRGRDIDTTAINEALESRAQVHLMAGESAAAMADLDESLRLYERRLAAQVDKAESTDKNKPTSSARRRARDAYRQAIGLELKRGETEIAYALAVRARAYSLSSSDTPRFDASAENRWTLPDGSALVHFCFLKDRVVIFLRTQEGIKALRSPLSPLELQSLIPEFRHSLTASLLDKDRVEEQAKQLYLALLEPIDQVLAKEEDLFVVAEDEIGTLPFAALLNPASGKFTIEDRRILTIPSEDAFQKTLATSSSWRLEGKKIALANPIFDTALWPKLSNLEGALLEGRKAREIFPDLLLFEEEAATPATLRREARDASLLLIAAHSVNSSRSAGRSVLLLAKSPGDSGLFYQNSIYTLDLEASPLVVLSACGTGKPTGNESPPSSIATAFLAAGASAVIAPLFDVDDQRTSILMTNFYHELAMGFSPAEALRRAQLSYIADSRAMKKDPWLWSFFGAHGASR